MNHKKVLSGIFALLGVLSLVCAMFLSTAAQGTPARLYFVSDDVQGVTEEFMDCVSAGAFGDAAALMLGQPRLNPEKAHSNPLNTLLWDTFAGSISYEFRSGSYPSNAGCRRDVAVTALDIPAVMKRLKEEVPPLLTKAVNEADASQIFDETGAYQEAFIMDILCQAAEAILKEADHTTSCGFTLELVFQDDRWWILPQKDLTDLLCGSIPSQE